MYRIYITHVELKDPISFPASIHSVVINEQKIVGSFVKSVVEEWLEKNKRRLLSYSTLEIDPRLEEHPDK